MIENVTIVTCDRSPNPNYLATTVAKLYEQGLWCPLSLQQGSANSTNIDDLPLNVFNEIYTGKEGNRLVTLRLPAGSINEFTDIRPKHNTNYASAFMSAPYDCDILNLEDDVVPCANLRKQLKAVYYSIENIWKPKKYIVSLYSVHDWGVGAQGLVEYPLNRFFGLQAVIYSANIRQLMHDEHLRLRHEQPADFVTRIVAKEHDIPVFATRFSLFQHIGAVTTGLGEFHTASNFIDSKH